MTAIQVTATPVQSLVDGLAREHRANLACILEVEGEDASSICNRVRWLYHSKVRAGIASQSRAWADTILSKTIGKGVRHITHESYPLPTWEQLIEGLGRRLKVHEADAELVDNEWYICDRIIVDALAKMSPKKRRQFFEPGASVQQAAAEHVPEGELKGPRRAAGALGLANLAGFGLYQTATTALAFVTQGVGISLPFAAYTGLTSTIAVVLGPVGWFSVAFWAYWRFTSTEWGKLTPAIIYLIQAKESERSGRV